MFSNADGVLRISRDMTVHHDDQGDLIVTSSIARMTTPSHARSIRYAVRRGRKRRPADPHNQAST